MDELTKRFHVALLNKINHLSVSGTVDVSNEDNVEVVSLNDSVVCNVVIMNGTYRIMGFPEAWCNKTTFYCERIGSNIWSYVVDSIDECIGDVCRLVLFISKQKPTIHTGLYREMVDRYDLDNPKTWKTDFRPQLCSMFMSLCNGTEYTPKINEREKAQKIVDLYDASGKRIMGIAIKSRDMKFLAFFDHQLFVNMKNVVGLPESEYSKSSNSQDHVRIDLRLVWNAICYITHKQDYME